MTGLPLDQIICGIPELADHAQSRVTHVLSILDPTEPDPAAFADFPPHERLTLRFDDVIAPLPGYVAPTPQHVEQLLDFGRGIGATDLATLLIHCHAGVSRSTASAAALLLQAFPDAKPDAVFEHIGRIRPQAWPNSRMVAFADTALGLRGAASGALHRFYGRRLACEPALAAVLRAGGRGDDLDRATQ